jgi:hypothetical protein
MSKHETPLTRKYWQSVGGTLIEEFPVVRRSASSAQRLLDGLIVLDGNNRIARAEQIKIEGMDVTVLQTKANRLGMYLMGQAFFSRELVKSLNPKSIRTVAICVQDDSEMHSLCKQFQIEVVIYKTK